MKKIIFIFIILLAACAQAFCGEKIMGIAFINSKDELCFAKPNDSGGYKVLGEIKRSPLYAYYITADGSKFFYTHENSVYTYDTMLKKETLLISDSELKKCSGAAEFSIKCVNVKGECVIEGYDNKLYCTQSDRNGGYICHSFSGIPRSNWSLDGTKFCYLWQNGLYIASSDGKSVKIDASAKDFGVDFAAFSPDSETVYYVKDGEILKYGITDKSKTEVEKVMSSMDSIINASVSEQGLAYADFGAQLMKIRLCGMKKTLSYRFSRPATAVTDCIFSPDGKYLLFSTFCDDNGDDECIYSMNLAANDVRIVGCGAFVAWVNADADALREPANLAESSKYLPKNFLASHKLTADFDGDGEEETAYVAENYVPNIASSGVENLIWIEKNGARAAADRRKSFNNGTDAVCDIIRTYNAFTLRPPKCDRDMLMVTYSVAGTYDTQFIIYKQDGDKLAAVAHGVCGEPNNIFISKGGGVYSVLDREDSTMLCRYAWNGKTFEINKKVKISENDSELSIEALVSKYKL